ncbi:MAG TPA: type II toxin-antitoxin system HicA family toxin, partial [Armatimonadetes bacterium]|nr:type II toxin-antitoxin system HicA family toxin [Armatimonadota bacterium]
ISGRKCVQALERAGFYLKRQTGSHLILRRNEPLAAEAQTAFSSLANGGNRQPPCQA